jgi:hypothetical protein
MTSRKRLSGIKGFYAIIFGQVFGFLSWLSAGQYSHVAGQVAEICRLLGGSQ